MKASRKFLVPVLLFVLIGFSAFKNSRNNSSEKLSEAYRLRLNEIVKSASTCLQSLPDSARTLNNYKRLRSEFKTIEFLLAQLDREYYLKNLNGAPLPKLEKHVPDLKVLEPHGLQVIDELIAGGMRSNNESLKQEFSRLKESVETLSKLHQNLEIPYDIFIQGVQNQLLRVYTLGITGFDTPGTLLGLEDAVNSLKGMHAMLSLIDLVQIENVTEALESNFTYIRSNIDFNQFDRLTYYKEYWQPLYASVIALYEANDLLTWNDLNTKVLEVNGRTDQMFSDDFFNLQAFLDFSIKDVTPKTIALGEKLFFDNRLSSSGKMSCATCHNPELGFSDGKAKSLAADQYSTLQRNAPGLVNAVYTKAYFYDVRADHLSQQFEHVIFSEDEFNTTLVDIFNNLSNSKEYLQLFEEAFPVHKSRPVSPYTFKVALAAYIASLRSLNSPFDLYMRGDADTLNEAAQDGYNLFMGKAACATCHFPPTFAGLVPPYFDDTETEVLGVPETADYETLDTDPGRYSVNRPKERAGFYKYSFKTTTVRNTSLTGPYMHNGVFETLDDVFEFYNNGGGAGHGLEVPGQTLAADSLNLSDLELNHIKAFINSLEKNVN